MYYIKWELRAHGLTYMTSVYVSNNFRNMVAYDGVHWGDDFCQVKGGFCDGLRSLMRVCS
jgi:hypothetical protein